MRLHRLPRDQRPYKVGRFKRALIIGPFQIPIMLYLLYNGVVYFFFAEQVAGQYQLPSWSIINFAVVTFLGSVTVLWARIRENARWETFGLAFVTLGLGIAIILSFAIHQGYTIGDEVGLIAGCVTRMWVISRARKAERIANDMVLNGHDPEGTGDE